MVAEVTRDKKAECEMTFVFTVETNAFECLHKKARSTDICRIFLLNVALPMLKCLTDYYQVLVGVCAAYDFIHKICFPSSLELTI